MSKRLSDRTTTEGEDTGQYKQLAKALAVCASCGQSFILSGEQWIIRVPPG